jgi:Single Cache-like
MSLRLRLLVAFGYVALLILVALEVPLALNLSRRIDAEVKDDAAAQAFVVAAAASGRMGDPKELRKLVRDSAAELGARVIVVDRLGRLVADSAGPVKPIRSYRSRPEIRTALSGRRAQGTRHSATLDEDLLYTAVPVTNNSRQVGAVRVTQNVEAVGHRIRRSILVPDRDRRLRAADRARHRLVPRELAFEAAPRSRGHCSSRGGWRPRGAGFPRGA